jgi:phage terminase large subunit-like protein
MSPTAELEAMAVSVLSDEDALVASVCRDSFWDFIKEFWEEVPGAGVMVPNWHMQFLADELQIAAERVFLSQPKEYDEVFNVPFGTSKSTICSILFHPWTWTRLPQARHLTATHTDMLALDLASKSREVIRSEKYRTLFPEIELMHVQDAKGYYMNTLGGVRQAFTVGGKNPMGFHFHFLGVDDPLDPQKAVSQAEIKNAREFMNQTLPSRKVDKAVSFTYLVMQRLDREDPTAVMVERAKLDNAARLRHVCLPGELTEDVSPPEWAAYYVDKLLDPQRLPWSVLKEYRAVLGPYGYAGQVLQKPTPPGGGMFKEGWFNQRLRASPYHSTRVRFWDRASTEDGGCYTAGVLMSLDSEDNYWVEHVEHGQWEPDDRNNRILAAAYRDRSRYGPKHAPTIVIEEEGGSTAKDARKMLMKKLAGFPVQFIHPTGSKDVRAEPWASMLAALNVRLVDDGTWNVSGYVQEHVLFRPEPGKRLGKYKDQVDASSGAFNFLLASRQAVGSFRVRHFSTNGRREPIHFLVGSREQLGTLLVEQRSLLVSIQDPLENREGVVCNGSGITEVRTRLADNSGDSLRQLPSSAAGNRPPTTDATETGKEVIPAHALRNCLEVLTLRFADLAPAEVQEQWSDDFAKIVMLPEQGKKLWSFLTRKREPAAEIVVIADEGDRRALSVCQALTDIMRLPRTAICLAEDLDQSDVSLIEGEPENEHAYQIVRASRGMVM